MKTTLTFPDLSEAEDGGFLFEIDGHRVEIPKFTDIIGSFGVSRRASARNVKDDDWGTKSMIALELAVKDDETTVMLLDHLDTDQGIELLTKWGEFTGAALPES
ncbi:MULTISPECIES: hypothetical protein [unclassified Microbacterium]|uniref:hypothetical protein n=1 Tax=unclassified Microbacterium TaxID=2609290 RepID=UPI0038701262